MIEGFKVDLVVAELIYKYTVTKGKNAKTFLNEKGLEFTEDHIALVEFTKNHKRPKERRNKMKVCIAHLNNKRVYVVI